MTSKTLLKFSLLALSCGLLGCSSAPLLSKTELSSTNATALVGMSGILQTRSNQAVLSLTIRWPADRGVQALPNGTDRVVLTLSSGGKEIKSQTVQRSSASTQPVAFTLDPSLGTIKIHADAYQADQLLASGESNVTLRDNVATHVTIPMTPASAAVYKPSDYFFPPSANAMYVTSATMSIEEPQAYLDYLKAWHAPIGAPGPQPDTTYRVFSFSPPQAVIISNTPGQPTSTNSLSVESNGDVTSIYNYGGGTSTSWITAGMFTTAGAFADAERSQFVSLAGPDTITVPAGTFDCMKLKITYDLGTMPPGMSSYPIASYIWLAKGVGEFVQTTSLVRMVVQWPKNPAIAPGQGIPVGEEMLTGEATMSSTAQLKSFSK